MTPRPYTAPQNATKNPQIIAGGLVAVLLLLVAAGFGIRRMSADPLTGTWTRRVSTQWQTEMYETLILNADNSGHLETVGGDPAHLDSKPDFIHLNDNFEWHKTGGSLSVQYFLTPAQQPRSSQFNNRDVAYQYQISDDGSVLTLTGFDDGVEMESNPNHTALFTRQ